MAGHGGVMDKHPEMTFLEFLEFLDEYWEIFGPPPLREQVEYSNVLF